MSKYYSKRDLWLLFSAVAFPIHIWAIILIFRDLSWVAERTNMADAIGVGAYGLLISLLDSIFIFLITILLGFLVSTKWDQPQRISLIGTLVSIVSIWAILGQLYFLLGYSFPPTLIQALANTTRPLRYLYALGFFVVTVTILVPVYGQLKFNKLNTVTFEFFERISLLVILYLALDIISIVIIVIRNL
jgi:hypothetical protein